MKNRTMNCTAMNRPQMSARIASLLVMGLTAGTCLFSNVAFVSVAKAADAPTKIGICDIEKAIKQTSAGQKMQKELQGEFEKKKSDFQKRDGDLRKMVEDLEKKKNLLSEEARQKKAAELQQENLKFQKEVAESQATIQKKERDMLEPIAKKMEEIIEKIAKDGGYAAILDRRAILWGSKAIDMTEEVVKEFEKSQKK